MPVKLRKSLSVLIPIFIATVVIGCHEGPKLDEKNSHLLEASKALSEGNTEVAMQELTASIDAEPNAWAYFERAKLHEKLGDDAAAIADCDELLKIDPQNGEAKWLKQELKKSKDKRFKGNAAEPPGFKK
ncbi:MAG: tetratricopeptide repeat protein [Pirellulaceae bacterium]